jgi:hypothetical protein
MTVHVENMTSEVIATGEDFPLSPQQTEMLVRLVMQRLEQNQRDSQRIQEATGFKASVVPDNMRAI